MIRTILGLLLALSSGCGDCGQLSAPEGVVTPKPSTDWRRFEASDCGFAVELPGEPARSTWDWSPDGGGVTIPSINYAIARRPGGGPGYILTCATIPPQALPGDVERTLELAAEHIVVNLGDLGGGPVDVAKRPLYLGDHPGLALTVTMADGMLDESRVYLVGNRLYTLSAVHDPAQGRGKQVQRVLESFRLVDEVPPPVVPMPEGEWWLRGNEVCPEGGTMKGGLPPEHGSAWCELATGERHGPYVRWRAAANPPRIEEGMFYRDRKHGRWVSWGADGDRHEQTYRLDVPHGPWTAYHADRTRAASGSFANGLMTGPTGQWDASGQQRMKGAYDSGAKTGTWTYWDERGQVTNTVRYENGQAVPAPSPGQ